MEPGVPSPLGFMHGRGILLGGGLIAVDVRGDEAVVKHKML